MKINILLNLFILVLISGCDLNDLPPSDHKIKNIILVRHAEKADDHPKDPELLPEGIERVAILTEMFSEWPFDKMYSTGYKRTLGTIQPLADVHGLEIELYENDHLFDFAQQILDSDNYDILISGHSDSTPKMVNYLIGEEIYEEMPIEEYNTIWWVQIAKDHLPVVRKIKFGTTVN